MTNPESVIAESTLEARKSYSYVGPVTTLTDEDRETFKAFNAETIEDIMMLMAYSMKTNSQELLTTIHDKLMVSDIKLAYDVLLFMLSLGDSDKMYFGFVEATERSKIDSKGIYRRCLGSLPFYQGGEGIKGYKNVALNKVESYPTFVQDIVKEEMGYVGRDIYKKYVTNKYADLIKRVLSI